MTSRNVSKDKTGKHKDALTHAPELKEPQPTGGSSSVSRMLDILDLFTLNTTVIQVETVGEMLKVGRSTCYRYLQELCDSGLLLQQGKGRYTLGPRVIELERMLQRSDPLLNAGKAIMDRMQNICDNRALLLCALYKDKVLCTYQTGASFIRHQDKDMPIFRDRGSAFPLFQGAGSQAILAYLAPHQIRALYLARQDEIANVGLAKNWSEFRALLTSIRKQGFVATVGKRNPKVLALGIPIISLSEQVIGSLLLLCQNTEQERQAVMDLVPLLQNKAREISELEARYTETPLQHHLPPSYQPQ